MFVVLVLCIVAQFIDVPQPCRLFRQAHLFLVKLKVSVFELLDHDGLVVDLFDLKHELVLYVRSVLTLLFKGLLQQFVVPFELCILRCELLKIVLLLLLLLLPFVCFLRHYY